MKKVLIASLALALPALASAQVQLISGYNFGQFLGGGAPALDGTTGDFVGSVGSNFRLTSQAPNSSSGDFVGNNGLTGNYSTGFGRAYWDGSNGSSNYGLNGVDIVSLQSSDGNFVNSATVQGYSIAVQGDGYNQALTSAVSGNRISFVTNTTGFSDYNPVDFVNGLGVNDSNFTFAAQVAAPVTINWFLNGSSTAFTSTVISGSGFQTYALDLDASFYGNAAATLVAEINGTVTFDNIQINGVIPEPSTYAAIVGALSLGFVAIRRRFQSKAA